jgi:GLPGLI family protein
MESTQKKTVFVIATLIFLSAWSLSSIAQVDLSGRVEYQKKVKFELKGMENMPEEMQNMMPSDRKTNHELLFSPEASLFQNAKNVDNNVNVSGDMGGGNQVQIEIREPESYVYFEYSKNELVEETEFMTRRFLITTPTDTTKWQITGSQREILGHKCIEAKLVDSKDGLTAWFTPEIAIPTGPDSFTGLPGLILALETESKDMIIEATKIEMGNIDRKDIKKPKKGKKVTNKEFEKIRAEKMKEMEEATGGNLMIIQVEDE